MLLAPKLENLATAGVTLSRRSNHQQLYQAMLTEHGSDAGPLDELTFSASRHYLHAKLAEAEALDVEAPTDLRSLQAWLDRDRVATSQAYRQYVDERRQGAGRRFFKNRAHALNFIRAVAPTKIVDGSWLYGALAHPGDPRLAALTRIYLEELGDGVASRHHVVLYKKLLQQHGCEHWQDLPDASFEQGAIQLALAHHGADLLPEVIGFNLGYEQLPLHLPITAYELNELGVDPYYFTLHVTIDNASTGHARQAMQCVLDNAGRLGDEAEFVRRVANGYKLNSIGKGSRDAIAEFDLDQALLDVFVDKAAEGALLHSDYCKLAGRTISSWLSKPEEMPQFIALLQSTGWIERRRDPKYSRFWRLLNDDRAPMFGVFNGYEQQVLHDWIVMDDDAAGSKHTVNHFGLRPRDVSDEEAADTPLKSLPFTSVSQLVRRHLDAASWDVGADEKAQVLDILADTSSRRDALRRLAALLSPGKSWTPAGLLATRIYADLVDR